MYEELIVPFFDKYHGSYSKGVLPSLEEVLRDFFDQKSIYKKLHQDNSLHSDINYLNSLKELHSLVGKIYYAYIHYFLVEKKSIRFGSFSEINDSLKSHEEIRMLLKEYKEINQIYLIYFQNEQVVDFASHEETDAICGLYNVEGNPLGDVFLLTYELFINSLLEKYKKIYSAGERSITVEKNDKEKILELFGKYLAIKEKFSEMCKDDHVYHLLINEYKNLTFFLSEINFESSVNNGSLALEQEDGLENFVINLTKVARQKNLSQCIGRKEEINQIKNAIKLRKHIILLGSSGSGKTTLFHGFVGAFLESNPDSSIWEVRVADLLAGTSLRGQMEERLKRLLQEAARVNAIIFFDEIHSILSIGKSENSATDLGNILKPYLSDRSTKFTIIGATTKEEYETHIRSDAALVRRFCEVSLGDLSDKEIVSLLLKKKEEMEAQFQQAKLMTVGACLAVYILSKIYLSNEKASPVVQSIALLEDLFIKCPADVAMMTETTVFKYIQKKLMSDQNVNLLNSGYGSFELDENEAKKNASALLLDHLKDRMKDNGGDCAADLARNVGIFQNQFERYQKWENQSKQVKNIKPVSLEEIKASYEEARLIFSEAELAHFQGSMEPALIFPYLEKSDVETVFNKFRPIKYVNISAHLLYLISLYNGMWTEESLSQGIRLFELMEGSFYQKRYQNQLSRWSSGETLGVHVKKDQIRCGKNIHFTCYYTSLCEAFFKKIGLEIRFYAGYKKKSPCYVFYMQLASELEGLYANIKSHDGADIYFRLKKDLSQEELSHLKRVLEKEEMRLSKDIKSKNSREDKIQDRVFKLFKTLYEEASKEPFKPYSGKNRSNFYKSNNSLGRTVGKVALNILCLPCVGIPDEAYNKLSR